MADEADIAQRFEQLQLAHALAFRQHEVLPRKGRCHNCGEPLSPDALFCDDACERDYRRLRRMRSQRVG
ncbi:MAG: DUF2116 family Zn-ribbon domain-containing protein [Steroidobacteraceae bacterium]